MTDIFSYVLSLIGNFMCNYCRLYLCGPCNILYHWMSNLCDIEFIHK